MICSRPSRSREQFGSRTELFIGSGHQNLMTAIYDIP
jgi:hypothetical protein